MTAKSNSLKDTVYARLEAILNAEKITREELRHMSRELLTYVPETDDIGVVNRLISGVTAMNRRGLILFFGHFLPWVEEKDTDGKHVRFGKRMDGEKKIKRRLDLIEEFLADPANDFWNWTEANVEIKAPDYAAKIASAINSAIKGNKAKGFDGLQPHEVVNAIFASNLSFADLMAGVTVQQALAEERFKAHQPASANTEEPAPVQQAA